MPNRETYRGARVTPTLDAAFCAAARALGETPSQALRRLMAAYAEAPAAELAPENDDGAERGNRRRRKSR